MKLKHYLIIGAVVLLFGLGFWAGWRSHSVLRPCPVITTDTILVTDTSWHTVKDSLDNVIDSLESNVDYWQHHRDTIKLPGDTIPMPAVIDTVAILKDYYAIYKYGWEKEDSNVLVKDSVIITRNTPIWNSLSYKLKKPQQIIINNIDNSITYQKYIQAGLYIPVYNANADTNRFDNLNNTVVELTYTFPRGYLGVGWQPMSNIFGIRAGTTVFKFRKRT